MNTGSKLAQGESDVQYMERCLALAKLGKLSVGTNPMVGAVIVKNGTILGEGFHWTPGEAHAEVQAWIQAGKPESLKGCTVYVSLEPCAHQGRTPSCAVLLSRLKPERVVVSVSDPDSRVSGKGIALLENSGIRVELGLCKNDSMTLNRHFMVQRKFGRPFITLKWAQSLDGFLGFKEKSKGSMAISGPEAKQWVHRLRAQHNNIAIGARTALQDAPALSVRLGAGNSPNPIVFWNQVAPAMATFPFQKHPKTQSMEHWNFDEVSAPKLLKQLHLLDGNSLLVEGGARLHKQFIQSGLWDEMYVLQSLVVKGGDVKAPELPQDAVLVTKKMLGSTDLRLHYRKKDPAWFI